MRKKRSVLNLIQYCIERRPQQEVDDIPFGLNLRGIYALLKKEELSYNVVYIGISTSDIRGRLRSHKNDKKKKGWTHFSFFKVWPNITDEEIRELEGLFLHIYSKDSRAQVFNEQRTKRVLRKIRIRNLREQSDVLRKF